MLTLSKFETTYLFVTILPILLFNPTSSANDGREYELADECNVDQFYYKPAPIPIGSTGTFQKVHTRCRNCSDLSDFFLDHQSWLDKESVHSEDSNNLSGTGQDGHNSDISIVNNVSSPGEITNSNNNNGGGGVKPNNQTSSKRLSDRDLTRFIDVIGPSAVVIEHSPSRGLGSTGIHSSSNGAGTAADQVLSRLVGQAAAVAVAGARATVNEAHEQDQDDRAPSDDYMYSDFGLLEPATRAVDPSLDIINGSAGGGPRHQLPRHTHQLISNFLHSAFIGNELLGIIEQCRQYQNVSACQMWSNICVMTMYSHSDLATSSTLRSRSSSSLSSLASHPNSYDSSTLEPDKSSPHLGMTNDFARLQQLKHSSRQWQKCKQFNSNSICNSLRDWHRSDRKANLDVQNIFALDDPMTKPGSPFTFRWKQPIQILAYKYSFNGNLLAVDQFGLHEMSKFCMLADRSNLYNSLNGKDFLKLGRNLRLNCKFNALLASMTVIEHINETVFYDLYLVYPFNGVTYIRSVPILIKNLLYNDNQINRKYAKDPSRWKLVYRFHTQSIYSLDQVKKEPKMPRSRKYTGSMLESEEPSQSGEQVIVYPKSAILELSYKRSDKGATLNHILLHLDYGFVTKLTSSGQSANQTDTAQPVELNTIVEVTQELVDMKNLKRELDLSITILGIMSTIWSLIKCYNLQKYYGSVKLDLSLLLRFILISCDTLAAVFGIVTCAAASYIYLTLKFQSSVQLMTPNEDLDNAMLVNLQLAFFLKLVGLTYKLYDLLSVDIFFIDWEKPKMLTSAQILNHYDAQRGQSKPDQGKTTGSNNNLDNMSNDNMTRQSAGPAIVQSSFQQQQTSFWRPYTIVNLWLKMQTFRRQNLTIQLLAFALIYESSGLIMNSISTDNVHSNTSSWLDIHHQSSASMSQTIMPLRMPLLASQMIPSFRLLLMALVYLMISASQILLKILVYEPMFRNTVHEFVDLCSVANVSIFCMLYPRFGYYIHGRNANGSGDCSIVEMNSLLEREELDLCSKRGLVPNSEQQTFILVLSRLINDHYKKLLHYGGHRNSASDSAANQVLTGGNLGGNPNIGGVATLKNNISKLALNLTLSSRSFSSNRAVIDAMVARNKAINVFLANFINHVYRDIDYTVKERRKLDFLLLDGGYGGDDEEDTTGSHSVLQLSTGIQQDKSNAGIFYADPANSFTSLFWIGFETDLVAIELLTLLTIDIWLGQPLIIITTSLVWLLHQGMRKFYQAYARQNLIEKALIDPKFLWNRN